VVAQKRKNENYAKFLLCILQRILRNLRQYFVLTLLKATDKAMSKDFWKKNFLKLKLWRRNSFCSLKYLLAMFYLFYLYIIKQQAFVGGACVCVNNVSTQAPPPKAFWFWGRSLFMNKSPPDVDSIVVTQPCPNHDETTRIAFKFAVDKLKDGYF
jgi:hypothetical protein